ncbi:MAG: orotidine-5'-phosphate decarboxylase [Chloroflexi bacterium]|nr:orotidine-5'-phosphate decarboxylase [Chloroflexota bacterium]
MASKGRARRGSGPRQIIPGPPLVPWLPDRRRRAFVSAFVDKLTDASRRNRSLLCVGLDVDPRLAPPSLVGQAGWVERFVLGIVEATADLVCAFKPNLAFFEALGEDGYRGLRRVLDGLPKDVTSIADAKRGDIGSTAQAYARALFDVWGFDAATVSPLLGPDTLEPFLAYRERGIFVLCKTSNPGAGTFQDLTVTWKGTPMTLSEAIAHQVLALNHDRTCGLVVGATYPADLARIRAIAPDLPILVPGVGAQHGDVTAAVRAGLDRRGGGIVVNASRGVLYASTGDDWQQAARDAALALRDRMRMAQEEHARATA